jgi:hypothetical protein
MFDCGSDLAAMQLGEGSSDVKMDDLWGVKARPRLTYRRIHPRMIRGHKALQFCCTRTVTDQDLSAICYEGLDWSTIKYPPVIARLPMAHGSVQRYSNGVHSVGTLYTHSSWSLVGRPSR